MSKTKINSLEKAVLALMLSNDTIDCSYLRNQIEKSEVKERYYSGHGFFTTFALTEPIERVKDREGEVVDPIVYSSDLPDGGGFVLFLKDGLIDLFEGFSYGSPWPKRELKDFKVEVSPLKTSNYVNRIIGNSSK